MAMEDRVVYPSVSTTLRWSSIFAGTFVSLLFFAILTALGAGFGAQALSNIIQGGDAGGIGIGSMIWLAVSFILSLFFGAFLVSRSQGPTRRVAGGTQGLVIASLFFALVLTGVGNLVGSVGKVATQAAGTAVSAAGSVAQNPTVQEALGTALDGLDLKSPPDQIAQGLITRLVQGDDTGARDYLADQAGISPTEAQSRLNTLKAQVQSTATNVGTQASRAASKISFGLCIALALGAIFGSLGGALGARVRAVDVAEVPLGRAA